MDESVHLPASQSHASRVKKKEDLWLCSCNPANKKAIKQYWKAPAECMQAAAVFQESAVAGSWQRPAVDWCYSHVEAFKKIRFPTQNIQSLMDCSQLCTFMGVGAEGIPLSSRPPLYSMHAVVWCKVSLKSHEWIMAQVACVLSRCVCKHLQHNHLDPKAKQKKRKKLRPKSGDEKLAITLLQKWTAAVRDMWLSGRHTRGAGGGTSYVMIDKPRHRLNRTQRAGPGHISWKKTHKTCTCGLSASRTHAPMYLQLLRSLVRLSFAA